MNTTRLDSIGEALERAAAADLATRASRTRRMPSRRFALVAAALAIVIPGGAVAATVLISNGSVAQSIPAGTLSLVGTEPTCTAVTAGVEYHCTLAKDPSTQGGPLPGQWKGTVEATVDASEHVNGGCRSLSADGRTWECYIGEAAVRQQIISKGFLGEKSFGPGVG